MVIRDNSSVLMYTVGEGRDWRLGKADPVLLYLIVQCSGGKGKW